jgi:hypothetical protein
MEVQALIAGVLGLGIGAAICYLLVRRDWLAATGALAVGATALLAIVTEGNRSHSEHSIVFAVSVSLILYFAVTAVIRQRRARSDKRQDSLPNGTEVNGSQTATGLGQRDQENHTVTFGGKASVTIPVGADAERPAKDKTQ